MNKKIELFCKAAFCIGTADNDFSIEEKDKAMALLSALFCTDVQEEKSNQTNDQIKELFLQLENLDFKADKGFSRLENIVFKNKELLDPFTKKQLLDCCIQIASVTNRLNKSELVMLSKIENLIKAV